MNIQTVISKSAAAAAWLPQRWQTNRAQVRMRLYFSLVALDLACIFASLFAANLLYQPGSSAYDWLIVALVLAPIQVGAGLNARAYSSEVIVNPFLGVMRAAQSLALATGVAMLIAFYLKNGAEFSRGVVTIGSGLSFLSLSLVRWTFLRRARRLVGGNPYSVALILDGQQLPLDRAAFSLVIHASSELDPDQDCPVMFDRLATALRDVDRVVIACLPERRLSWVRMLKGANIRSELIAPELMEVAPLALDSYGDLPTMVVADGPLGKFDTAIKRSFDIAVSALGLLLFSLPMLIIVVLIKLSRVGPILFVQTRIGQGNRQFRMFKFRSMRVEQGDHSGHRSAGRDDERITPIGRFMRKTSIDELPQLLNVLHGEMSIVGPRPHALGSRAEDLLFWEVDNRYWHRHAVKPGLTGLAQIRGFRGATEKRSDLTDRLQADLEYLHNWTLRRDLVIVLQTFRIIIHRNAF